MIKSIKLLCAAAVIFALPTAAKAVTGEEVMSNMNSDLRFGYISGSIEASAFLAHTGGDRERSACIRDWFFETDEGPAEVVQALDHFRDRQAQPVILALINRACPTDQQP